MGTTKDSDTQAKDVLRQEQFWFTATTLGFTGFVGTLLKTPNLWEKTISLSLIWMLTAFTIYLVVGRHKAYCNLNGKNLSNWCSAFMNSVFERSGSFYCIAVVSCAAIGFTMIISERNSELIAPTQSNNLQTVSSSSTSAVIQVAVPIPIKPNSTNQP